MRQYNFIKNQGFPSYLAPKIEAFNQRVKHDWKQQHIMRGRTASTDSILLCSNDYLSLANHSEIIQAQTETLMSQDDFLLMSAIFLDDSSSQGDLEGKFAHFFQSEDAILCQSGYAANVGLIQSICENTDTPIYIDSFAHMSLWDGIKMAGKTAVAFRHNDVEHLAKLIKKSGPGLVVVDSVYSTNGSLCPLVKLVSMAHKFGCTLLVDESHSFGTHGPQGKGLIIELGLQDKVMFRTASLAKAFGGRAGLICCPPGFADFFKFTSKPSIFSSAMLPHELVGLKVMLDLIARSDDRRSKLHKNTKFLHKSLTAIGYNINDSQAQIIALESGTEWQTILLRDALEKRGIFGSVFCAPATPKARALIRFSVNAGLTEFELQKIVRACHEIVTELDVPNWRSSLRLQRRKTKQVAFRKSA